MPESTLLGVGRSTHLVLLCNCLVQCLCSCLEEFVGIDNSTKITTITVPNVDVDNDVTRVNKLSKCMANTVLHVDNGNDVTSLKRKSYISP